MLDAVLCPDALLGDTEEYALGHRELRKRLQRIRRWYTVFEHSLAASDFSTWSNASWVLVILNPALLVSNTLLDELLAVLATGADCALPADPRGYTPGVVLDYASRPGFDRFVARLTTGPRCTAYDHREPWIYLVSGQALRALGAHHPDLSWQRVPALLASHTLIAQHAFVHSYADYHLPNRCEMLRLLPGDILTLLDVGGGAGHFALHFMQERGGQATLLERNAHAAALARARGIEVIVGDFGSIPATRQFDCVALLDVLEHLPDPLMALVKAHSFLKSGGALLLSVPNVGHWSVVWDLLEGHFDYQPVGILCNTHVRFFTRRALETLIADAGYRIQRWEAVCSPPPEPFARFITGQHDPGVTPDLDSLATESFHVLARRD